MIGRPDVQGRSKITVFEQADQLHSYGEQRPVLIPYWFIHTQLSPTFEIQVTRGIRSSGPERANNLLSLVWTSSEDSCDNGAWIPMPFCPIV